MGDDKSSHRGALLRAKVLLAQAEMQATGERLRAYQKLLAKRQAENLPEVDLPAAVDQARSAFRVASWLYAAAVKDLAQHDTETMSNTPSVPTAKKDDPA